MSNAIWAHTYCHLGSWLILIKNGYLDLKTKSFSLQEKNILKKTFLQFLTEESFRLYFIQANLFYALSLSFFSCFPSLLQSSNFLILQIFYCFWLVSRHLPSVCCLSKCPSFQFCSLIKKWQSFLKLFKYTFHCLFVQLRPTNMYHWYDGDKALDEDKGLVCFKRCPPSEAPTLHTSSFH